jgi:uncharacterized protein
MENDDIVINKTIKFIDKVLENREWSHGIEHCKCVLKNALNIWDKEGVKLLDDNKINPLFYTNIPIRTLIGVVALLHDVCDHKYKNTANFQKIKECQTKFLQDLLNQTDIHIIVSVIDNISFSKEQEYGISKNLTDLEHLIRNVVSDADKLEALGYIGIKRCMIYQREVNIEENQGLSEEQLKSKAIYHMRNKILKLYPDFFRTKSAMSIAHERHEIMKSWLEVNS